jgi:hypothetical protein
LRPVLMILTDDWTATARRLARALEPLLPHPPGVRGQARVEPD